MALLIHLLAGRRAASRALVGLAAGMGLYGVTLAWMSDFNIVGGILVMALESGALVLATLATPPGRGRRAGWVGAVVLQEWLRGHAPLGGVPMGGMTLGQASGWLAPAARVGGALLVTGVLAAAGVVVEAIATGLGPALIKSTAVIKGRGRAAGEPGRAGTATGVAWRTATFPVLAAVATVAFPVAGLLSPSGRDIATIRVAAVQGGGRRGLRAVHGSAQVVLAAAFAASRKVRPPVDLVLWPEDVIALDGPIAGTPVAGEVGQVAVDDRAALLAGVTESVGDDKFRNAIVVWDDSGRITGRFDKVHRVPFGEYVPGRSLISHLVSLDVIPRDAIAGTGSGALQTQAGPVGVVISFEVYFSDRARSAVRGGGQVLLAPTNTASFTTTQVTTSEIATAELRAWETGREVVMAAPTGFSAVIDSRGRLRQRSHIGTSEVLMADVHRRTGATPYLTWGDLPVLIGAAALLAGARSVAALDRKGEAGQP